MSRSLTRSSHRRTLIDRLEARRLLTAEVVVDFGPAGAPVLAGAVQDVGLPYADRGNGHAYGWNRNVTTNSRNRASAAPDDLDTFIAVGSDRWELALPNGRYNFTATVGDPSFTDSVHRLGVEGQTFGDFRPTNTVRNTNITGTVDVTDGRLTLAAGSGGVNVKIASIRVGRVDDIPQPARPSVRITAIDGRANESGNTGTFRIGRSGPVTDPLVVNLTVGGGATGGADYVAISSTQTIPAGREFVEVVVSPIEDTIFEPNETVTLVINPAGGYAVDPAGNVATVRIFDNDPQPAPTVTLQWTAGPNSPMPRVESQTAVVNGRLFVFGGYNGQNWVPQARNDVFDPATNAWTRIADMPLGTTHAGTAVVGEDVWLAGGYVDARNNNRQIFGTTQVLIYNTRTNSWRNGPALPERRSSSGLAHVNGRLFLFGGDNSNRTNVSDHWMYDLANPGAGWVRRAPVPAALSHFGTAVLDGQVYAIGGQTGIDAAARFFPNSYRYDPRNDTWTRLADLPFGRSHLSPSTTVRDGRIVVMGGERAFDVEVANVTEYDPLSNTWRELTPLATPRASGAGAWLGDRLVFTTGKRFGTAHAQTWIGVFR